MKFPGLPAPPATKPRKVIASAIDYDISSKPFVARRRAFAYTVIVTLLVVIELYFSQNISSNITLMLYVHIVVLVIFLIVIGIFSVTQYRPGEGALLAIILLDAVSFAYFGYLVTLQSLSMLLPTLALILAVIVAFGCALLPLLGFALLAR